jgi:hypothetical protein
MFSLILAVGDEKAVRHLFQNDGMRVTVGTKTAYVLTQEDGGYLVVYDGQVHTVREADLTQAVISFLGVE